jgi:hypothetical protein
LGGTHNLYDSQILPPAQKWLKENAALRAKS